MSKVSIMKLPNKEAAVIGLKNRLYVPNWSLNGLFKNILKINNPKSEIFVAFCGKKPIGISVLDKDKYLGWCNIGIFVKQKYRNRGVGRALMVKIKEAAGESKIIPGNGVPSSKIFFHKALNQ